jgi:hypothetical protein
MRNAFGVVFIFLENERIAHLRRDGGMKNKQGACRRLMGVLLLGSSVVFRESVNGGEKYKLLWQER